MCECDLCKYYRKENDYCGYSDMGNGDVRYAPCYRTQYEEGYVDGQRDGMKWIPVSERLPENEKYVLVCDKEGFMDVCRGSWSTEIKDEWIWYSAGYADHDIIAWMPLPEPAKKG